MKTILPTYWKIYAALLVIFVSGSTLGYVAGNRPTPSRDSSVPPPTGQEAESATDHWAEKALEGLAENLDLTPEQEAALLPVLGRTGDKVNLQRDRALFQIYLEVLAVHDEIAPYLTEAQQKKLARSKDKMHLSIESRFQSLIDEPARPDGAR